MVDTGDHPVVSLTAVDVVAVVWLLLRLYLGVTCYQWLGVIHYQPLYDIPQIHFLAYFIINVPVCPPNSDSLLELFYFYAMLTVECRT